MLRVMAVAMIEIVTSNMVKIRYWAMRGTSREDWGIVSDSMRKYTINDSMILIHKETFS